MITFKLFDLNKENMKFLFVGKYQANWIIPIFDILFHKNRFPILKVSEVYENHKLSSIFPYFADFVLIIQRFLQFIIV